MQEWDNGYRIEVSLLRSHEWLAEAAIKGVGDMVEMDFPEMGVEGEF